jgi:hypothetical protein
VASQSAASCLSLRMSAVVHLIHSSA